MMLTLMEYIYHLKGDRNMKDKQLQELKSLWSQNQLSIEKLKFRLEEIKNDESKMSSMR